MTTVNEIRDLHVGSGRAVVPVWPDGYASPDWQETEWREFGEAEDQPFGGTWEGAGGSLVLEAYPYAEVCVMLTGVVALVDSEGGRREYRAGDAFVVPVGFTGVWETIEPATKVFVALPPSGDDDRPS